MSTLSPYLWCTILVCAVWPMATALLSSSDCQRGAEAGRQSYGLTASSCQVENPSVATRCHRQHVNAWASIFKTAHPLLTDGGIR